MIIELLPAVALITMILVETAIRILINLSLLIPVRTLNTLIVKNMWFSSEILPIMSINTKLSVMIMLVKRTPHSFEVKHIKIIIILQVMNKLNHRVLLAMCEGAIHSIVAFFHIFRVVTTKLHLVLFGVIKVFNMIMAKSAIVSFHTNQFVLNILTDFARILILSAPTIHFVMEIRTSSMVVVAFIRTF